MGVRVAIVGDRDPSVIAHRAVPRALDLVGAEGEWIATETIHDAGKLEGYDGVWCVPKTPYRSTEGALSAVRYARESGVPFLGTCGGFQHAVVEYARNVLGWDDAGHAEVDEGGRLVIAPLSCSLVEVTGEVRLFPGTRIGKAYGTDHAIEGYHCSFGLNPEFREALASGPLRVSAEDGEGSVRALELDGHPFFVITLFQPERVALEGRIPPIVRAFAEACA